MKLKHVFFAMLATGLFAACNNDDIVVDNPQNEVEGEAFIALKVALPSSTSPGTRTGQGDPNDEFADGDKAEYDVKDLTVVVFDTDGDNAVAQVVLKPDLKWETNTNTANITMSSTSFLKGEDGVEVGTNVTRYVLVIANNNGLLNPAVGQTYGTIKAALTSKNRDNFKSTGFFMSNSPIVVSKTEGETKTTVVQTLAPCKPQATVLDAQKAENYAEVYLERILGKVEVKASTETGWNEWTYTVPSSNETTGGDQVIFTVRGLDITNTTTFPIREVKNEWITYGIGEIPALGTATKAGSNFNNNRFIGEKTDPQRIYWAIDPNYETTNGGFDEINIDKLTTLIVPTQEKSNIDYCLENTFDVANQKQDRTTRMVMQGAYKFKGQSNAADFYRSSKGVTYTEAEMKIYIASVLKIDNAVVTVFAIDTDKSSYAANVSSITYQVGKETPVQITGKDDDVNKSIFDAAIATIGTLDYYKGGVCYYIARIKHFGDLLTPWDNTTNYTDNATGNTYAKDYLGRYGVVRNNWYELTISKADKGPGEPVIPPTTEDPDDELTYYIDCKINILSWAKRTQNVEW